VVLWTVREYQDLLLSTYSYKELTFPPFPPFFPAFPPRQQRNLLPQIARLLRLEGTCFFYFKELILGIGKSIRRINMGEVQNLESGRVSGTPGQSRKTNDPSLNSRGRTIEEPSRPAKETASAPFSGPSSNATGSQTRNLNPAAQSIPSPPASASESSITDRSTYESPNYCQDPYSFTGAPPCHSPESYYNEDTSQLPDNLEPL
jgi:hypothetical protein